MKKCVINTKTDSIIVFIAPNGCIGLLRIDFKNYKFSIIIYFKTIRDMNYNGVY